MELLAMNKVAAHVRNECVATAISGERVSAVDGYTRCGSEVAGRAPTTLYGSRHFSGNAPCRPQHAPRLLGTDTINFRRGTVCRNVDDRRRHGVERIARGVAVLIHHQLDVRAVVANKLLAVIAERHA